MIVKELTDERLREFWEGCGFIEHFGSDTGGGYWQAPNGDSDPDLPSVSLGSIFQYAVPAMLEKHTIMETYTFKQASGLYYSETEIWDKGAGVLKGRKVGSAFAQSSSHEEAVRDALFQAIAETIQNDKRTK